MVIESLEVLKKVGPKDNFRIKKIEKLFLAIVNRIHLVSYLKQKLTQRFLLWYFLRIEYY